MRKINVEFCPAIVATATKRIIGNFVPIGRLCQCTQDNEKEEEEDDPLRSGECEKCECVGRGRVEENEKEAKTQTNEDGERVEGKERWLSKSSSSPRAFLFCSTSPRMPDNAVYT